MSQFDFVELLYREEKNRESLLRGLDRVSGIGSYVITMIPYASLQTPTQCFPESVNRRSFSLIESGEGVHLFELVFIPRKREDKQVLIQGKFFVYEHPSLENIYLAATIEEPIFVKKALIPFMEQSHRIVHLPFIKQQRLSTLLHEFKMRHGYSDLSVVRASIRSRFVKQEQRAEAVIPSVSWPNLGLDGAFRYALEQDGWFRSLTFHALRGERLCTEVTIQRNGLVRCNRDFANVVESLVLPVCEELGENFKLFGRRSRRESKSLQVRPLSINFGMDRFINVGENSKFIEVLRLLENSSASVLHSNPYVHLSLVDYVDGSTFDLWILNTKELVIVPQLKGTVQSIKRLVSHIFDNYAEGNVADFKGISQ
jgi:hypothetical protein